jgi:hypothetical protein
MSRDSYSSNNQGHLELQPPVCDQKDIFCTLDNAKAYLEFVRSLERILSIPKHDFAVNPLAFIKICRILKYCLTLPRHIQQKHLKLSKSGIDRELLEVAESIEEIKLRIIQRYLVIGLPIMECNPGAVTEVWSLIENYPYEVRYQIYEEWFTKLVAQNFTRTTSHLDSSTI